MLDNKTCPKCGTEIISLQIDGEQRLACFKYGLSCDYVVPKETQAQLETVVTNTEDKPSNPNGSDTATSYYDKPMNGNDVPTDNTKLYRKPPLGVVPRELWVEDRKQDLARAIHEYVAFGDCTPVKEWAKELIELVDKVGE